MSKNDLIGLGLRWGLGAKPAARDSVAASPSPADIVTAPADSSVGALRAPAERLLTLLRDFVAVVELSDQGGLLDSIDACLKTVSSSSDWNEVMASIEACNVACRSVLAELDRQRLEQQEEIATLVDMVREALAIVAGDGQTFNRQLGSSMQRFEALVEITDVRQLKTQLVHEIGELRHIAEERQKTWEETCQKFTQQVDSLERQLTATKHEASLDSLTRISNRGAFDRAFRAWVGGAKRDFVLAVIDIDQFKQINDIHGHGMGDRAIVAVAQSLKSSVRSQDDVVARIGGDEFAALIATLSLRQGESRMRLLNTSLTAATFSTQGLPLKLTLSCGVAEYSAGDTMESLMERADSALREAKRLGRNRVVGKAKPTLYDLRRH
jgi:diguanylate cyclase